MTPGSAGSFSLDEKTPDITWISGVVLSLVINFMLAL